MDDIKLQLRLLIPDVDPENQIYSDEQILAFYAVAKLNIYRAASLAVGALSVDEAITYKVIKTDDQSIDGAAVADALRKRAIELENLARKEDEIGSESFFSVNYPQPQIVAPELIPVSPNDLPYWEFRNGSW